MSQEPSISLQETNEALNAPSKTVSRRAMVMILVAGSLWGCIGLFNRHLFELNISPASVVLLRNTGACIILGLIFLFWDRSIFRIRLRHLPLFLLTGLVSIIFFTLCYFRSQEVSSLAVAAILLYTAPTFVVILSRIFFKEKFTKRKIAALIIAFLGCSFVAGIGSGGLAVSLEGLLLGVGSGVFYASYSIFGRFALKHYQPFTVTFYTFLVAAVGSFFFTSPSELSALFHSHTALLLAFGLCLTATVFPYLLYTKGLNDLGDTGKASILASIEPIVASIVGILAFGEPLGFGTIAGLICVLASVFILR